MQISRHQLKFSSPPSLKNPESVAEPSPATIDTATQSKGGSLGQTLKRASVLALSLGSVALSATAATEVEVEAPSLAERMNTITTQDGTVHTVSPTTEGSFIVGPDGQRIDVPAHGEARQQSTPGSNTITTSDGTVHTVSPTTEGSYIIGPDGQRIDVPAHGGSRKAPSSNSSITTQDGTEYLVAPSGGDSYIIAPSGQRLSIKAYSG